MRLSITLLLITLVTWTLVTCGQTELKKDVENKSDIQLSFPDIINQIKGGIAYLEVGTNIEGISKTGTAFLIHELGIFVTCRHTLFDPIDHGGRQLIPDTSRVFLKFHNYPNFYRTRFLTQREDKDIVLIRAQISRAELDSLNLVPLTFGKTSEIREGTDIACTGYDFSQKTDRFDKTYYWLTTHGGIISCVFEVGPDAGKEFVDFFQVDMLVNEGASGGPVYLTEDGRVLGMCRRIIGKPFGRNYGLVDCIPAWAIYNLFADWIDSVKAVADTTNIDTTKVN